MVHKVYPISKNTSVTVNTVYHEMFIYAHLNVHEFLATSNSVYYTNKINPCGGNQKTIFNVGNKSFTGSRPFFLIHFNRMKKWHRVLIGTFNRRSK